MKNQVFAFILCLAFVRGYGQLMINQPYPGTQTYDITAPEYIRLMPGFEYIPQSTNYFRAYIDPNAVLINPVTYLETPVDPENRPINTGYEVGTTAGQASVSLTGGATYTIPIYAAPGTAGMQPSVSLVYNSQAGNGIAGYGWSIAGLSSITRVPYTIYHDGAVKGVDFYNDRFALDGQRLISLSGFTYGADNAEYYTEVFNVSKIISHGTTGQGPVWFEVRTKEGQTIEYGNTTDSRFTGGDQGSDGTISWNISKIRDANGNYMLFVYYNSGKECFIKEIQYTGNAVLAPVIYPYNKIKFYYAERTDKSNGYIAGKRVENNVLLDHIDVLCENNNIKTYKLKYYFNLYSKLNEIEEYERDNERYNSTVFGYKEDDSDELVNSIDQISPYESQIIYADFNDDGLADCFKAKFSGNEQWFVYLNNGTQTYFNSNPDWSGDLLPRDYIATPCDLNGDGLKDILLFERWLSMPWLTYQYQVKCLLNNGDGFTQYTIDNGGTLSQYANYTIYPSDIDGDQKDEYFIHYDFEGSYDNDIIRCYKCNIDGANVAAELLNDLTINASHEIDKIHIIDIDGDGRDELLYTYENDSKIFKFSNNNGVYSKTQIYSSGFPTKWHNVYPADYNGDGSQDLLVEIADENEVPHWYINYWIGNGFMSEEVISLREVGREYGVVFTDFNGDGKADIAIIHMDLAFGCGSLCRDIFIKPYYKTSGSEFIDMGRIDIAKLNFYNASIVERTKDDGLCDMNGDGISDLAFYSIVVLNGPNINYIVTMNPNEKKNLLNKVADGFNNISTFQFMTLTNNEVYQRTTQQNYPLHFIKSPYNVVRSISYPDGLGGFMTKQYKYFDGVVHLQGKGFLGFKGIETTDNTTGFISTSTSALNSTYYFLMPDYSKTEYPAGILLSETNSPFSFQNIYQAPPKVFLPYQATVTSKDYFSGTKTINESTIDQYCNPTLTKTSSYPTFTATTATGYSQTAFNNYTNAGSWCPSKPLDVTNTLQRAGETVFTKNYHITYDALGNVTQTEDFYGLTKQVTTDYINATVGMPLTSTVSAFGLISRVNSVEFDTRYRFAIENKDAEDYISSATFDPAFGNKLSATDANGLTSTFTYNGFGMPVKSTNPEGVWVNTELKWFSGNNKPNVLYYIENTSNNGPVSRKYYDKLGRVLYTSDENPDGQMVCTKTEYNSKRLVTSVSEPYFDNSTPSQYTTSHYDAFNRPDQVTLPSGVVITYTNPTPSAQGLTSSVTNCATAITTSKTMDATGKVVSATDPGGTITYSYYSHGNPKAITAPDGNQVTMTYDVYGRQENLTDPDAGTISYVYNAFGELTEQTDAKLNKFVMVYDKLGRLLTKTCTNDNSVTTNTYIPANPLTPTNGKGLLSSTATTNGTSVSYVYDPFSRIIQKTEHADYDFNYFYTYDTKGNMDEYTFPSGYVIKYAYNTNGSLANVTDKAANIIIYQPGQYNALGQMTDYVNQNGTIFNTLTYDDYGMPATVMAGTTLGGSDIQYLETHFNQYTGNLEYRTDHRQSLTETFTYDPILKNRLASWQVTGQPQYSMTYEDNNGNVLTKSDFTSTGNPYNYTDINDPNHPHAVKSVTAPLQFPAEALQHISYNILNKVSEITHTNQGLRYTIDYGPDEQRVKSQYFINNNVLQKTKYYVGGDYEEEVNSSNVVTRRLHYLPGGGLYVLDQNNNGTRYYVLTDYQGSWCRVITGAGATVERYSFDPWGRRRHPDNWNIYYVPSGYTFDRGYTGHEMLDAFGLINMNGRVYDPIIARFLSPDNYVQAPDNSQGFNRYSYCLNNPLTYSDPTGEFFIADDILIAMAAAAIFNGLNSGVQAELNGSSFWNGALKGALTGAISGGVGAYFAGFAPMGVFPGAFFGGITGGFAGGFTSGISSSLSGGSFGDGFISGFYNGLFSGAIGGGISGGYRVAEFNKQFGDKYPLNIWSGNKLGDLRNEWSFFNWDRPNVIEVPYNKSLFQDGPYCASYSLSEAAYSYDRDIHPCEYADGNIDPASSGGVRQVGSDGLDGNITFINNSGDWGVTGVSSFPNHSTNFGHYVYDAMASGQRVLFVTQNYDAGDKIGGHEMFIYKAKVWHNGRYSLRMIDTGNKQVPIFRFYNSYEKIYEPKFYRIKPMF